MLQAIRDKTQNWISIVIIGFLILMFGMWGISYYLSASSASGQELAKINDQSIPLSNFQSLYNLERQAAAPQVNAGLLSLSDLKSLVLSEVIENQLLYQAAVSAGLGISVSSIDTYIVSMPSFQDNKNQFSNILYQNYLQRQGLSTAGLREKIKKNILMNQWNLGAEQSDFVLPHELENYSAWMNQSREIQWTSVNSNNLDNSTIAVIAVSPEEAMAYYKQHPASMMAPAKIEFEYVSLSLKDLKKKLAANPQAGQQAEEQYADLGNQLANLSFENPQSLDPAASQLGLVVKQSGWIFENTGDTGDTGNIGNIKNSQDFLSNPKLISAAFSPDLINSEQNSDPINLSDPKDPENQTVVVLRVTAHEAPQLKPFSQVQAECEQAVRQEKQAAALIALAAAIQTGTYKGPALPSKTYTVTHAGVISGANSDKPIPGSIISAAFIITKLNNSQIISLSDGSYAIVKLLKIIPPKNLDSKIMAPLAKTLRETWVNSDALQYLNNLKSTAKIIMNPSLPQSL